MHSTYETHLLPAYDVWKMNMDWQNLDKINIIEPDETVVDEPSLDLIASRKENDVEISLQQS